MNETLGKLHFWGSVVFITLVFGGQLLAGLLGPAPPALRPLPVRVHHPPAALNRWTSYSPSPSRHPARLRRNFFYSVFVGKKASREPVGGDDPRVDARPSPPVVPQLRRRPDRGARPARVRQPRGEEALKRD